MFGSLPLLPGVDVCHESSKVALQLTNLRVCHRYRYYPDPQFDSITLDAIASTGLRTQSRPVLLIIAAILILLPISFSIDMAGWQCSDFGGEGATVITLGCRGLMGSGN